MGPIKEGDRFFRVRSHGRSLSATVDWVVVTKVGRRWADFRSETHGMNGRRGVKLRFDIESMTLDGNGFTSPGRVYRSEEEWREDQHARALWTEFRRHVDRSWGIPEGVTKIAILKAADALGLKLEAE